MLIKHYVKHFNFLVQNVPWLTGHLSMNFLSLLRLHSSVISVKISLLFMNELLSAKTIIIIKLYFTHSV